MTTRISVQNLSTKVTDRQVATMCKGLNQLLRTFCTDWSIPPAQVVPLTRTQRPATRLIVYILDDSDTPGALGYHDESGGIPYGTVFANTILQYGGAILNATGSMITVAQCLSHEVFELLIDINANVWWYTGQGNTLVAAEVSDPVESNVVRLQVDNTLVAYSDWILPKWMDPQATKGPFNHLNTLTAPFTMSPGGYLIVLTAAGVSYVFGDKLTEARKGMLKDSRRATTKLR